MTRVSLALPSRQPNQTTEARRAEEAERLSKAREGDAAALRWLYDAYQPMVSGLSYRLLERDTDVEDAVQTTFIHAFRALEGFRGDSSFKTWLLRIAYNECMDMLRKRQRSGEPLVETLATEDGALKHTERLAVRQAMARLSPDHRAILTLHYWQELSYEEIASVLGLSMPTVKMRLFRAREEFRRRFIG